MALWGQHRALDEGRSQPANYLWLSWMGYFSIHYRMFWLKTTLAKTHCCFVFLLSSWWWNRWVSTFLLPLLSSRRLRMATIFEENTPCIYIYFVWNDQKESKWAQNDPKWSNTCYIDDLGSFWALLDHFGALASLPCLAVFGPTRAILEPPAHMMKGWQ